MLFALVIMVATAAVFWVVEESGSTQLDGRLRLARRVFEPCYSGALEIEVLQGVSVVVSSDACRWKLL